MAIRSRRKLFQVQKISLRLWKSANAELGLIAGFQGRRSLPFDHHLPLVPNTVAFLGVETLWEAKFLKLPGGYLHRMRPVLFVSFRLILCAEPATTK